MHSTLNAIEVTGVVSDARNLRLDEDLPENISSKVRIIVLYSADGDDIEETEWLQAASNNTAFDFLNDSEEDIYTIKDGKAFSK